MTEAKGMFQLSSVSFLLIPFLLILFLDLSVSKLCLLCLYSFLTFISPSRSSDPVSHILTYSTVTRGAGAKKTMHVKGERQRGSITAPSCPLTADLYLSSIGPSQVPATENLCICEKCLEHNKYTLVSPS